MMPPFSRRFSSLCLVCEVTLSHAFSRAKACRSLTPSLTPGHAVLGHLPYQQSLPRHLTPSPPDAKQRPRLPLWEAMSLNILFGGPMTPSPRSGFGRQVLVAASGGIECLPDQLLWAPVAKQRGSDRHFQFSSVQGSLHLPPRPVAFLRRSGHACFHLSFSFFFF